MREPKFRTDVQASGAEDSIWERVLGEREEPFVPCQLPSLTGVRNHHALFGLLGFRGITDPVVTGAINALALEPSSVVPDPSSLDPEPHSLQVLASVKHATPEPASVGVIEASTELSSPSESASGAMPAATKLDPVATTAEDFATLSKVDLSAALNSAEISPLAPATQLVGDVFIHDSAIPVPGSGNLTAVEDFRSDISAILAQDLSVQTTIQDYRFDISAIPAQGSSAQTTAEYPGYDISAISDEDASVQIIAEDARSDINDWSAGWRAAIGPMWDVYCCGGMCGRGQSPGGLDGGQQVLNNTVDLGLLSDAGSSAAANLSADASTNPIVLENMLPGSPESEWGIDGGGSDNIEGFATDISVDHGHTISFKINTDSTHYRIDIYRIGYYDGDGARKVATIDETLATPQDQPIPLFDPVTKLLDAGNWSVSATWDVPADAVSGVYFAKLTRLDGVEGENIIPFIVRDDENPSDITFQTSDTTWEAYNPWGGYNLYGSIDGGLDTAALLLSATIARSSRVRVASRRVLRIRFCRRVPSHSLAGGERLQRQLYLGRRHGAGRRTASQQPDFPVGRPRRVLVRRAGRQCDSGPGCWCEPGILERKRGLLEDALGDEHRRLRHALSHAGHVQGDQVGREHGSQ